MDTLTRAAAPTLTCAATPPPADVTRVFLTRTTRHARRVTVTVTGWTRDASGDSWWADRDHVCRFRDPHFCNATWSYLVRSGVITTTPPAGA